MLVFNFVIRVKETLLYLIFNCYDKAFMNYFVMF